MNKNRDILFSIVKKDARHISLVPDLNCVGAFDLIGGDRHFVLRQMDKKHTQIECTLVNRCSEQKEIPSIQLRILIAEPDSNGTFEDMSEIKIEIHFAPGSIPIDKFERAPINPDVQAKLKFNLKDPIWIFPKVLPMMITEILSKKGQAGFHYVPAGEEQAIIQPSSGAYGNLRFSFFLVPDFSHHFVMGFFKNEEKGVLRGLMLSSFLNG